MFSPIIWRAGQLQLLDQRQLPKQETWLAIDTVQQCSQAISDMVVRGAPAIGITAAYGVVLAARQCYAQHAEHWREAMPALLRQLAQARPTAVNLCWAINTMQTHFAAVIGHPEPALLAQAQRIHQDDIHANQTMGALGAQLLPQQAKVLTHCNAGALATGGYGTALGVIRSGFAQGKISQIYADETRPWWQGARLTAWELLRDGLPVTLLADSAAAMLMQQGKLDWVIVGADRIAANGDVANKIGTYGLAVLARYHGVKFMVVAPRSTFDLSLASGAAMPLEQRDGRELLCFQNQTVAAQGADSFNPVFDLTPAALIDAMVSERGVILQPDAAKIAAIIS